MHTFNGFKVVYNGRLCEIMPCDYDTSKPDEQIYIRPSVYDRLKNIR